MTTHDLPTVAGLWSGRDLAIQRTAGLEPTEDGAHRLRQKLLAWTGVEDDAAAREVTDRVYRLLASAPSAVVTATLEDALAVEERPNLPGTTAEWPNWCLALPQTLEQLPHAPLALAIAAALGGRRGPGPEAAEEHGGDAGASRAGNGAGDNPVGPPGGEPPRPGGS